MSDYNYEPKQADSVWLKLKEKGDIVTIRLTGPPYREPKVWKEGVTRPIETDKVLALTEAQWMNIFREPDYNVAEVFHWQVIDRDSGLAKIFTGTPGIYKQIKKFAEMPAWGDPKTYDLQIERTEAPGLNYYSVMALPNKEPLSDKEQRLLGELDFAEKLPAARKLTEQQVDFVEAIDGPMGTIEDEPAVSDAPPANPDTVIVDGIEGTPINLDDIPF